VDSPDGESFAVVDSPDAESFAVLAPSALRSAS
jgi:hypothetical protein